MKDRGLIPIAALATVLWARGAAAQTVRPHVLIIFDTSGSMLFLGKDGTALCGGAGTESRIHNLKQAMREALIEVGAGEANFGLQRFPQKEDPTVMPTCAIGHYMPESCSLSSHGGEITYGAWFDVGFREAIVVRLTKDPSPGPKPGASDFDPPDGNLPTILKWIDETEDTDTVAPIDDPELRAGLDTPLGRSLFYARLYFDEFIEPADPLKDCRKNIIILVTDGDESCDTSPGTLNSDCSGSVSEFNPRRVACRLFQQDGIKTYVVTDSSTGVDGDNIAAAGGTGKAVRVTLTDKSAVKAALTGIIAEAVPESEVCNGKDDNCNGMTDEGVSNMCPFDPVGLGHCAVETCNCKDDDCDGDIDDGLPTAGCGLPCGCAMPTERCDGIDNNCDGKTDEGFALGGPCDNGLFGECARTGVFECSADGTTSECSAPPIPPAAELCNGLDDDCDGMTDEDHPLPGEDAPCGLALGECKAGHTVCKAGKLECEDAGMSMPEICDGLDNDCNGTIDDATFPESGMECKCDDPLEPRKGNGIGECHKGKLVCRNALKFQCEMCGEPHPELCDGKDNDCDGTIDNGDKAQCPDTFKCREGQCALPCAPGEFPCPSGCGCKDGFCICSKCASVRCDAPLRCDPTDGKCKDPCAGKMCAANETCVGGECVDCTRVGCPAGKRCVAQKCEDCPGGVCEPCAKVNCSRGQYCLAGKCVPRCLDLSCPPGELCAGEKCRPDRCVKVACTKDQFCDPQTGQCKNDPCKLRQCKGPDERCIPTRGTCEADPCATIRCYDDCLSCLITPDGIPQCGLAPDCHIDRTTPGPSGGGGCGCRISGSSPTITATSASTLLLGAIIAARRLRGRGRRRGRQL